ncbi:aspartic proteinase CDR1-like [Silene latifolia]|uniref:aspartic proteinase CDR1-like n=1 Tax=Silene latifolia TaxID=37657 RepID=UPI003D783910
MHAMVNYILFMALVMLPLFQLFPSPNMGYARKLTTKNEIFSVDLIRRNSSKITLRAGDQGRFSLGSISHHHQITLSSKFYDKTTVQTVVIPDGGAFDMKISIGTPPVEFTAIADTGSDLIWVQCSPCQRCIGQQPHLFDPTQSSTDNIIACTSQFCDANQLGLLQAGCSQNDNSCMYTYGYVGGTQTRGVLSRDTVTFPPTSISDVVFGCGYNQEGTLGNGDGLVGLGGGPLSLVSQLGPNINYKFSYCLTPESSGVTSKLNFGIDVTGPGVISTPFDNQNTPAKHYYVSLDSISIGDTSVPVTNTISVDSGTTLTYLPSDVYEGIKNAVEASIGLTPVNGPNPIYPNQKFDPCYETDSLDGLNFPGMVFHFSGGDVMLKAENSFITGDGLACFTMVPTDSPTFIFGNIAQTNFHIGYDLQAQQVSFAPADCTQF